MRENYVTDQRLQDHPAASIDAVVADPDDIVETFLADHREGHPLREHVLRLTPPYEDTEVRAQPYVKEGPERHHGDDPEPINLPPATFVENADGVHPEETHLTVPTREEVREQLGEDVDDEGLEEAYEAALEEWEQDIRNSFITTIRVVFEPINGDEVWADARYESEE